MRLRITAETLDAPTARQHPVEIVRMIFVGWDRLGNAPVLTLEPASDVISQVTT